jgi:hypothetical protein
LKRLLLELESRDCKDTAMRQLWLEMQWLAGTIGPDGPTMPRQWELILFQMLNKPPLSRYPEMNQAAIAVAQALREFDKNDRERAG